MVPPSSSGKNSIFASHCLNQQVVPCVNFKELCERYSFQRPLILLTKKSCGHGAHAHLIYLYLTPLVAKKIVQMNPIFCFMSETLMTVFSRVWTFLHGILFARTLLQPSDSDSAKSKHNQGAGLLQRVHRDEELETSITLHRAALDLHPTSHPDRPSLLNNLAIAVITRFQQKGSPEDLDESIELFHAVLNLRPIDHSDRPSSLNNLGNAVKIRFEQKGRPEDLEESISLHREALSLRPTGHPYRSSSLNNLANALISRFEQKGRPEDLDESIIFYRNALALRPTGHPDRPSSLNNLGNAVKIRFEQKGRPEDLEESISLHREALGLHPTGHPDRPASLLNLASAVTNRFEQKGRLEDLEESISLHREALGLYPTGHPDRPSSLNNLADIVKIRFQQRGCPEDLDESIDLFQAALDLQPTGHPGRPTSLSNLANAIGTRFQQRGRLEDLDESISLQRAALELRPSGHPDRPSSLNSLSSGVMARFEQRGNLQDLDESIVLCRAALDLHPIDHPERPTSLNDLASGVMARFQQRGRLEDLDESIDLFQAALALQPTGHPGRPTSLSNLANAIRTRFDQGRPEDLDKSISLLRAVLYFYPTDHPDRATSLNDLAFAIMTRFEVWGRAEDWDESIKLFREALNLRPIGDPNRSGVLKYLALSMKIRFLQTDEPEDLEECMCFFESAALDEFCALLTRLEIAVQWAKDARIYGHSSTLRAYQEALSLLQLSLTISPTLQIQHDILNGKKGNPTLALDAASYATEQGDLEKAIEMLEQGRGLVWAQMRSFRTPAERLSGVEDELVDKFLSTSRELEALSTFHESKRLSTIREARVPGQNTLDYMYSRKRVLADDLRRIIEAIRSTAGSEDFLRPPRFSSLQEASIEGPVIVVIHSRFRSDALIVLHDVPPVCVELDPDLHTDGPQYLRKLKYVLPKVKEQPGEVDEVLGKVLKFLWDKVVAKVVAKLDELGIEKHSRIWWCPTSFLSGLPFHAAGPVICEDGEEKYLPDLYISSYTPTLSALVEARSRLTASAAGKPSVLVVAQTDGSLPKVGDEVKAIESTGKSTASITMFMDAHATPETVMSNLRHGACQPEWIHFACHGHLNPKEPFNHYFELFKDEHTDGHLTLLDIMGANIRNAQFAFLSACHSAEQHVDSASEEVIHLAAAVQFSGFRGVVGTMWALADEDGPWIAKRFYKSMFDKKSLEEVGFKGAAKALNSVTRGLRDLGPRRGMTLERWVNFVHVGV